MRVFGLLKFGAILGVIVLLLTQINFKPKALKLGYQRADLALAQGDLRAAYIDSEGLNLHYVTGGDISKPAILFIHGTPGDWRIFGHQLSDDYLRQQARVVAVDRPGWGHSSWDTSLQRTDFSRQARLLYPLLKKLKQEQGQLILVGHSLGGSLVPVLAATYPELVDGVFILAGDLSVAYFHRAWYNTLIDQSWLNSVLPRYVTYANDEVIALTDNLEVLLTQWSNIQAPLWILLGGQDFLVDPKNAEFANLIQTQSQVKVVFEPQWGHFMHLKHANVVSGMLVDALHPQSTASVK